MQAIVAVTLFLCIGAVFAQPQKNLYPITADGFDVIWLDDISFATELHIQDFSNTSFNFFVFGRNMVRTVYPWPNFYAGQSPSLNWNIPFINIHTFQNGTDVWGLGPVNPLYGANLYGTTGYQLQVAVVSTTGRSRIITPIGTDGTYFSATTVPFDPYNVITYFAGFFPTPNTFSNGTNVTTLSYGVIRTHLNVSAFSGEFGPLPGTVFNFNQSVDVAVLRNNTEFITYNVDFRPHILHVWNVSGTPVNSTFTIVVDPYFSEIHIISGSYDPTVPLTPLFDKTIRLELWRFPGTWISSATVYYPGGLLIVGVGAVGTGTGGLLAFHIANFTQRGEFLLLPTNYSDPKALVVDEFRGKLYVGMNGGWSILEVDIASFKITGYQPMPHYLHRVWSGRDAPEHVYFITNEQHSKVFRVAKTDFCSVACMEFAYCSKGKCTCAQGLVFSDDGTRCEWPPVKAQEELIKKEHAGEVALGVLFALTTVAAAVAWYLIWKNRRSSYQAV